MSDLRGVLHLLIVYVSTDVQRASDRGHKCQLSLLSRSLASRQVATPTMASESAATSWCFAAHPAPVSGATSSPAAIAPSVLRALSVPRPVAIECAICWNELPEKVAVAFEPCSHHVCRICAISQIRATLVPDARGVPCPVCVDMGGLLPATSAAAEGSALRRRSSAREGDEAALHLRRERSVAAALVLRQPSRVPAPLIGEMTEEVLRRLHLWSIRPTTKLPTGVRPLTVDDVLRFVRARIRAAVEAAPAVLCDAAGSRRPAPGGASVGAGPVSAAAAALSAPVQEQVLRCPKPECGALLVVARTTEPAREPCPHCDTPLCIACGAGFTAAHEGRSCTAAAALNVADLSKMLLGRRQGCTFKPCPRW